MVLIATNASAIAWQVFLSYVGVLIGIALILPALLLLVVPRLLRRWQRSAELRSLGGGPLGCVSAVVAVAGLCGAVLAVVGPSPWERARIMSNVLNVRPEAISSAEIIPSDRPYYQNPIRRPILVRDHDRLKQLCDAINQAVSWVPNHPRAIWECKLRLCRPDMADGCKIVKTENNGVLLRFVAGNDTKRYIGDFRCDALGPLIESWAKEDGK